MKGKKKHFEHVRGNDTVNERKKKRIFFFRSRNNNNLSRVPSAAESRAGPRVPRDNISVWIGIKMPKGFNKIK